MLDSEARTLPHRSPLAQDPLLREVVSLFVEEMPSRIARMRAYFADCEWHALRLATRQLTTGAIEHGFDQLVPFSAELEHKLTRRAATVEVERALENLVAQCSRLTDIA